MIIVTSTTSIANEQNTDSYEPSYYAEENGIYDVISAGIGSSQAYLSEMLQKIHNDSGVTFGSDWAIITMLRAGKTIEPDILDEYYSSLTQTIKGWDSNVKPTDVAKVSLAYAIMDKDITNIEGVNLINLLCNNQKLANGANELAYSLLAIYASQSAIPEDAIWNKSNIIAELLTFQAENGGFGLFDAETADVDMTAICVQALAPYKNETAVSTAINKAIHFLSDTISDDWDYNNNPNTAAQVLLALASLNIDVTDPENGFGNNEYENIITSLEKHRSTDENGYFYDSSVNAIATYQIMQAYDAYRKSHKDGVLYWDFGTDGQIYDDTADTKDPAPEKNEAKPVDIYVTIADNGNIVTDKNGCYVAQAKVTVSDLDQDGTLTVNEALYATHETLYIGGAQEGYSTFIGDNGLSLAILWGKGTKGVLASAGYYLNNESCWSLNDVVNEGDYLSAFNYFDTSYWSDAYSYFNENTVSVNKGSLVTLTLCALGYDEFWNQVSSPYPGAKVEILQTGGEVLTTDADGKVEISTSALEPGTYFAVAYTDAKNIVPAVCKIIVTKQTGSPLGDNSHLKKINITVKVMVHDVDCNNSYTYSNDANNFYELVSNRVSLNKNETVYDALAKVLNNADIKFTERNGYVSEIGGYKEFSHGARSGWMFTVNGEHKNTGCRETKLTKDSTVLWYYTDDYTKERSLDSHKEDTTKTDNKQEFGLQGKNDDITYKEIIKKGKTFADIVNCTGKTEIEALAERGIINGKTDESYDPYSTMTRAEFATIVVNALGLVEKSGIKFEDVNDDKWYAPYVRTAYHYGIVNGVSQTSFNPNGTVTTEEAATILERAAKLSGIKTNINDSTAKDVLERLEILKNISIWSISSMGFCIQDGILDGDVIPKETVTREKVAIMLYRILKKAELI